jgi:hypothetical protein
MGELEQRDGAGHAGGAAAEHRVAERQGIAAVVEEHVGRRPRRRDLAPVIDGQAAVAGVVIVEEGAAAEARALRLDQREHGLDGDRRVDRAAAAAEDVHAGLAASGLAATTKA